MTIPVTSPSAPNLQIASRRSGIDRVWGSVFAVAVVLTGALVVGFALVALALEAPSDDGAVLVIFAPVAPFFLFLLWRIWRSWRQLRAISTPVELDTHGLTLQAPQGTVRCPWEAVTSIGFGRIGLLRTRVIVIRLHPQAGPGVAGIESTVPPRSWHSIHRHGLRYATWLLDIEDHELATAIATLSADRVHLLPAG